jgi:hypothetical protein
MAIIGINNPADLYGFLSHGCGHFRAEQSRITDSIVWQPVYTCIRPIRITCSHIGYGLQASSMHCDAVIKLAVNFLFKLTSIVRPIIKKPKQQTPCRLIIPRWLVPKCISKPSSVSLRFDANTAALLTRMSRRGSSACTVKTNENTLYRLQIVEQTY